MTRGGRVREACDVDAGVGGEGSGEDVEGDIDGGGLRRCGR